MMNFAFAARSPASTILARAVDGALAPERQAFDASGSAR